jgi:FkbM family methyltransferase
MPTRVIKAHDLEAVDPGFKLSGRWIVQCILYLPRSMRQELFFSDHWFCPRLQKALQRTIGGIQMCRVQLIEGPLSPFWLECWSSEKYFLIGYHEEDQVQAIFERKLNPGDTVYDIGANIGCMSLLFSKLCGPEGRVLAFEPSAINFGRLTRNIEINKVNNITALQLAVSDEDGEFALAEQGVTSFIFPIENGAAENCSQIRAVRLDSFIFREDYPLPDYLKIDVEGHAGKCLAGMTEMLRKSKPIIVCELHDVSELAAVSSILAEHSYSINVFDSPSKFPRHIIAEPQAK